MSITGKWTICDISMQWSTTTQYKNNELFLHTTT